MVFNSLHHCPTTRSFRAIWWRGQQFCVQANFRLFRVYTTLVEKNPSLSHRDFLKMWRRPKWSTNVAITFFLTNFTCQNRHQKLNDTLLSTRYVAASVADTQNDYPHACVVNRMRQCSKHAHAQVQPDNPRVRVLVSGHTQRVLELLHDHYVVVNNCPWSRS